MCQSSMQPPDVTGGGGDVLRPTNVDPIRHGCCHTPFLFSFVPILSFGKTKQNNPSSMQKVPGVLSLDSHRTKSCCHTAVSVSFNQILFLVCGCCRWRVQVGRLVVVAQRWAAPKLPDQWQAEYCAPLLLIPHSSSSSHGCSDARKLTSLD